MSEIKAYPVSNTLNSLNNTLSVGGSPETSAMIVVVGVDQVFCGQCQAVSTCQSRVVFQTTEAKNIKGTLCIPGSGSRRCVQ